MPSWQATAQPAHDRTPPVPGTSPPLPKGRPPRFRATVHGTVFSDRERHLEGLREGERLKLVADPPGQDDPSVWVHLSTGEPVGHLPPEVGVWLWPWMQRGGVARVRTVRVRGGDVPSWRRMVVEVTCGPDAGA